MYLEVCICLVFFFFFCIKSLVFAWNNTFRFSTPLSLCPFVTLFSPTLFPSVWKADLPQIERGWLGQSVAVFSLPSPVTLIQFIMLWSSLTMTSFCCYFITKILLLLWIIMCNEWNIRYAGYVIPKSIVTHKLRNTGLNCHF